MTLCFAIWSTRMGDGQWVIQRQPVRLWYQDSVSGSAPLETLGRV